MQSPRKLISHIAKRRQDLDLTQRELANLIGVTETTIRNWEKGNLDWLNKVALLCELLACSPEDLTENFKHLREAKNLTQLQISQFVNVVENTVGKWEKGNFDWAQKAVKLCQSLQCRLHDLYDVTPEVISSIEKEKAPSGQEILTSLNPEYEPDLKTPLFPFLHRTTSLIFYPKVKKTLPKLPTSLQLENHIHKIDGTFP